MDEVHYLLDWKGDYVAVTGPKNPNFDYAGFDAARQLMISDPNYRTTSFDGTVIAEVTLQYMNEEEIEYYLSQKVIFGPNKGKYLADIQGE